MTNFERLATATLIALAGAMPGSPARAAHLVNTGNFGFNAFGCAVPNGLGNTAGTAVFLDSTCSSFRVIEWAFVQGKIRSQQLLNNPLADGCLDIANGATSPGTPVVVNACDPRGTLKSQQWFISGTAGDTFGKIVNVKTKLCLDTVLAGPSVTQVVVNSCSVGGSGQSWFVE